MPLPALIPCLLLLLLCGNPAQARPLTLAMPYFPPYSYLNAEGQPDGTGVIRLQQLLTIAGIEYRIVPVPNYGRALAELEAGDVDGFFIASPNNKRSEYAHFFGPLMLNRWSWFYFVGKKPVLCQSPTVTIINTNTQYWLEQQGCGPLHTVHQAADLISLLTDGRVSAAFVARKVMREEIRRQGLPATLFTEQPELVQPFGLYIAHSVLQEQPALARKINDALLQLPPLDSD
ncbi:substrate-binding periplasmic protein [Thalassolituus hydrocarboniclasticus]|uniref:Transporter substrate-binding domain-containing protein n=1 Tax=Thalassolituus hydrocarboniclasticus TaxID=2742796 RepID=A0ABY6A604_9GAMM|nr:transporter substrate-binding domain-containing protein [Thalassolituus hydrocarboniclasticus]UXD86464.1 transporter substrate-binding domain-containing protein [Thalassolituus hydrocarboniclasticus]